MAKKKEKKPGIIAEFKKFITRGNVVDMATGVIVAGAFTKIITALTNNVFMPIVNWLVYQLTNGKDVLLITVLNGKNYFIETQVPVLNEDGTTAIEIVKEVNPECIFIDWGIVIEAVVNFLLIAIIIFSIVKIINGVRAKLDAMKLKLQEEEIAKEKALAEEQARIAQAEAEKAAIAQAEADKEKAASESTNALLVEIINLLKK